MAPESPSPTPRSVAVGAATLVFGLLLFAGAVFGLTAGVGAVWSAVTSPRAAAAATTATPAASAAPSVRQISMVVNPPPAGGVTGPDGQVHDAFVPGDLNLAVGVTYQVTVKNYDQMPHTWTAPGLGLDVMIAAGSDSAAATTTFTIKPTKAGTFEWHCATPCDSWSMAHDGYMRGTVTVAA